MSVFFTQAYIILAPAVDPGISSSSSSLKRKQPILIDSDSESDSEPVVVEISNDPVDQSAWKDYRASRLAKPGIMPQKARKNRKPKKKLAQVNETESDPERKCVFL